MKPMKPSINDIMAPTRALFRALENGTCAFTVRDGVAVHPHWESHPRGRNFVAVVQLHAPSPGGLYRQFLPTFRAGQVWDAADLRAGDVLEFGSDRYTGSGRKAIKRSFACVLCASEVQSTRHYELITSEPAESYEEAARHQMAEHRGRDRAWAEPLIRSMPRCSKNCTGAPGICLGCPDHPGVHRSGGGESQGEGEAPRVPPAPSAGRSPEFRDAHLASSGTLRGIEQAYRGMLEQPGLLPSGDGLLEAVVREAADLAGWAAFYAELSARLLGGEKKLESWAAVHKATVGEPENP